jgi:hypothetical protein
MMMEKISNIVRSRGDPKVIETGPSSFGASDRMARNLGWFSIGLGALELLLPERVTRTLGMEGQEIWSAPTASARSPAASSLYRLRKRLGCGAAWPAMGSTSRH